MKVLFLLGGGLVSALLLSFVLTQINGKQCGGIATGSPAVSCPSGYRCKSTSRYPDAMGQCVFYTDAVTLFLNKYVR